MAKLQPLNRSYGGIPIVEAQEPLEITVLEEDKKNANRKDPSKCVFAQACKRLFHGIAAFYKHVAYVEQRNATRKSFVYRYRMTAESTRYIIEYDRTGRFKAGTVIKLLPPPPAHTLEYLREHKQTVKRGPNKNPYPKKKSLTFDTSVRNGTGSLNMSNYRVDE